MENIISNRSFDFFVVLIIILLIVFLVVYKIIKAKNKGKQKEPKKPHNKKNKAEKASMQKTVCLDDISSQQNEDSSGSASSFDSTLELTDTPPLSETTNLTGSNGENISESEIISGFITEEDESFTDSDEIIV